MANHPSSYYGDIGVLGEDLVAQWLSSQGWEILDRRWRCRWGEIDIIAQREGIDHRLLSGTRMSQEIPILAFVEVKTRSDGSWDGGGRNAIAPKKQAKIWRTAQMFLASHPDKAEYACTFDVAIVASTTLTLEEINTVNSNVLASLSSGEHQLTLLEYIAAAFEASMYFD